MSLVNSIAGKLISKTPTLANVEIGGFVFNVKISLASFEKLPKINENITLLTHLHVKEDILELYGFVYETERSLFLNLNKINGIGPRSAMNILSGTSPAEFKQKIIDGDVKSLTSIPGIGAKTAKRIIIELKEVFSHDLDASEEIGFDDKKETSFARDATSALKSLGYKENQISKAISELQRRSGIPDKLEDVIREILKRIELNMKYAKQLQNLGTETAFAVSAQARQWSEKGNKVYPFHLGDINLPTPKNIVEATVKSIKDGLTGYCPSEGIFPLREALANDVGSKRGVLYEPDNVAVQPGGKPTIGKFIASVMNPGDEILYPNPGYPIYESQIEYQGGRAVPYSYLQNENGFEIDLDKLKDSISSNTVALIYNNYQNPISAESSAEEMHAIADIAIKNDLWVLSDEAYFEIVYEGEARSIVNIPGMLERTVILYTFSKKFAMTGWRVGGSIGPKEIISRIAKLNVNAESCTTHFIQNAMVEALCGDQSGAKEILNTLQKRRDAAVLGLNAIDGIDVATPRTTFYLFPNITKVMQRKGIKKLDDLQRGALENSNVSFCTREHFGRPQNDESEYFIRLAYSGISTSDIREGLYSLKQYFESS